MQDYCIFIGRFSMFHNAHLAILEHALTIAKEVIIVIGSAGSSRTVRNPWTATEREQMISASLSKDILNRIKFIHMKDYLYNNNLWVSILQEKISNITNDSDKISLIGHSCDEETAFYLKLFPQFQYIEHAPVHDFHATHIRDYYFSYDTAYQKMVPKGVLDFLDKFQKTAEFSVLKQEKKYLDDYKLSWSGAPHAVLFLTVDCLVVKSGHILLIKRGHNPGKGLLAMPGGFVNQKEKIEDAALRELKEETNIKVNIPELRKAIVESRVFDDPMRSARGRVISHTYLIDLGVGALPKVKEGDDARSAQWIPLSDFYTMEEKFFEDHFHIIRSLISKY